MNNELNVCRLSFRLSVDDSVSFVDRLIFIFLKCCATIEQIVKGFLELTFGSEIADVAIVGTR